MEEETDAIVNQVLSEVGLEHLVNMASVPTTSAEPASSKVSNVSSKLPGT